MRPLAIFVCLGLALPGAGFAQDAHEHGTAQLDLAIDTHRVLAVLHGPGHSFVGFERAPETTDELAALQRAHAVLSEGERLLGLPEAAVCIQQRIEVEGVPAPVLATAAEANAAHGNWRIEYRFLCEHAAELDALVPRLLAEFPPLREVRWQLSADSHQDAGRLDSHAARIPLQAAQ